MKAYAFAEYPNILSYFNFNPEANFRLNFNPGSPVLLYCGSNGPLGMAVGGENMDGLIFGGHYVAALRTGRVPKLLETFDNAASRQRQETAAAQGTHRLLCLPCLSYPQGGGDKNLIVPRPAGAREWVKESAGHRVLNMYRGGYTNEDIQKLGVALDDMERLDAAEKKGASESPSMGCNRLDDRRHIYCRNAGDCLERMLEVRDIAREQGFGQLMFSELGPDLDEAMTLLCDEVIPSL